MPNKILYIEDDPLNLRLVRVLLSHAGYEMLEASDGIEGLEIASREIPDLILMDIRLPRVDGATVTSHIKTIPELEHIPVLALTAHTHSADIETYFASGCSDIIPKPITREAFLDTIARFMNKQ